MLEVVSTSGVQSQSKGRCFVYEPFGINSLNTLYMLL